MLIWKRIMSHRNGTGTSEKLLIKRLKVSGLLSFGPTGIDLPMRGLNVLIGVNGSGKSNFLEILALVRSVAKAQLGAGGELLRKGEGDHPVAEGTIDVTIAEPDQSTGLRHILTVFNSGPRLEVADERIEAEGVKKKLYYRYDRGKPVLGPPSSRTDMAGAIHPDRSVLAQVKESGEYCKGGLSFRLLAEIDPQQVEQHCPSAKRLLNRLRGLLS